MKSTGYRLSLLRATEDLESTPSSVLSTSAASETERAMTPTVSSVGALGWMPAVLKLEGLPTVNGPRPLVGIRKLHDVVDAVQAGSLSLF